MERKFEVITVCGSSKFKDEITKEVARLTLAGKIVISLGMFGHTDYPDLNWEDSDLKLMLDEMHLRKIDMADRIYVVNPNGYIGKSTAKEIAYAKSLGKPVDYMI